MMIRISRVAALAAIGLIASAASAVAEPVLCAKEKKGQVKGKVTVRQDVCKNKEVQIDLGDFGAAAVRSDLEDLVAALEARVDGEVSALESQVASLQAQLAAQTDKVEEVEAMTELLAVQQNHVEERGSIDDFDETAFTSVAGLATVAPHDGFLMVWANLNAEYDFNSRPNNVDLECRIAVDGTASSIVVDQEFADVDGGTNSGESVAVSTVVPVSQGARSVDLECRKTGSGLVFVKARSLTTLFVTLEGEAPVVRPLPLPRPIPVPLPSPLPGPVRSLSIND